MAEKIKKISVNAFEKAAGGFAPYTVQVEWNGIQITVKTRLGLSDVIAFTDAVVKTCFGIENAEFIPEVKEFAIRDCIIRFYTNITMPSNAGKRYDLVFGSDIIHTLLGEIDDKQFSGMLEAIDEKIDYIIRAKTEAVTKQLNEVWAVVDGIKDQFSEMLSSVSGEDIQNMANALLDGKIDEEKLVEAVMKSKTNDGDAT